MDARRWNIGLVGYGEMGRILVSAVTASQLERRPPRPSPQPSPASGKGGIRADVVRAGHVAPE